jgi:hypothetical protein
MMDLLVKDSLELEPYNGTIELSGSMGAFENEWYNFTISAQDEEGGLTFWTNSTMTNIQVDPETGDVSLLPNTDDIGTVEFYIIATDDSGAFDSVRIVLEVVNVNDPPLTPIIRSDSGSFVFAEGDMVKLTCIWDDPDIGVDPEEYDEMEIVWSSDIDGNLGVIYELETNELSIGNHTITSTLTDKGGLSSSASVHVLIFKDPGNPEPNEIDPNATGGEVKTEKEGAPIGLIVVIIIVGLILLAGVVVLVMMIMRKKDTSEEVEPVPEGTPQPVLQDDT